MDLITNRIEPHESERVAAQSEAATRYESFVGRIEAIRDKLHAELDELAREEESTLLGAAEAVAAARKEGVASAAMWESVRAGSKALQQLKEYRFPVEDYEDQYGDTEVLPEKILCLISAPVRDAAHVDAGSSKENGSAQDAAETVYNKLLKAAEEQNNERIKMMDKIDSACDAFIEKANTAKERVDSILEKAYMAEDSRLQAMVCRLLKNEGDVDALAGLVVKQSYGFTGGSGYTWGLKVVKGICVPEKRVIKDVTVPLVEHGTIHLAYPNPFSESERQAMREVGIRKSDFGVKVVLHEKGHHDEPEDITVGEDNTFSPRSLKAETEYSLSVKLEYNGKLAIKSEEVTFTTPGFSQCCVWVNVKNIEFGDTRRIISNPYGIDSSVIGSTQLPPGKVTSWSIKVLKSEYNDGTEIFIGVARYDTLQNGNTHSRCKWYFSCVSSTIHSGPPHNYRGKEYGPRKERGQYVHTGDSVGVVMDTTKGDLSFALDGVNLGVAFEGIPLDKPLVPWIDFHCPGDSVELVTSEVKETEVSRSVPVPSNITVKNITWDSITLTWDKVGDALFYQIEVDESKSWDATTANSFTKQGLLPDTKHSFRVRTVRGSSVSEWSSVVKGRTLKAPEFSECVWKKCLGDVYKYSKYSVNGRNPRIATKVVSNGYDSTIIGNTCIPLNKVTSWNVKILKSRNNDGCHIYIGVAPSDINQNKSNCNYYTCGWYFYCYDSTLWSGPPHKYSWKEYSPRKDKGEYVHTGDSVGVVVDTTRGELSFVLNGVNRGVAYEGIPLDEPLVPCVLLWRQGDSVELILTK